MLSLPIPPSVTSSDGEEGARNKLEQSALRRLLLVGPDKSGTSTIFKQVSVVPIHANRFLIVRNANIFQEKNMHQYVCATVFVII